MEGPADQFMTLATNVNFKMGPYEAAKEGIFYELNFFPGESYSRIHTLQFEDENFNESASRSVVPDIIVEVKRIQKKGIDPMSREVVSEVMTMRFDNPAIGTPWFGYEEFNSESKWFDFKENIEKVFDIKCSFFGNFSMSVRRNKDGCPTGDYISKQSFKKWEVVFGHNI